MTPDISPREFARLFPRASAAAARRNGAAALLPPAPPAAPLADAREPALAPRRVKRKPKP